MKTRTLLFLLLALLAAPAAAAEKEFLRLRVAWNNPFNPAAGEFTRFEYSVAGQDRAVRLFIFASDGRLVRQLADHLALPDAPYAQDWDGLSDEGRPVDSGLYFVVLDADEARKTARVYVKRK